MFSSKDLRRLIIPLILQQLLSVFIGIVDTVMVSSAGDAAVAGISLIDSISSVLVILFTALTSGGSIIVTQYIGKGSPEEAKESAKQLEFIVLAISTTICLVCVFFRAGMIDLIYGSIEADVFYHASRYFLMVAISYPLLGIECAGTALFRGMAESKIPLKIGILMNVINIVGNAIFIYAFKMGAMGAGLATLISRFVGAFVTTALLMQKKRPIHLENLHKVKPDKRMIYQILRIGIPNAIETSMFFFGRLLVSGMVSTFGTAAIAANSIAGQCTSLQSIPCSAIGSAMLTVIGRHMGANDIEGAKKSTVKLMALSYIVNWIMIAVMLIVRDPVMSFYAVSDEGIALATELFIIFTIYSFFLQPASLNIANTVKASGDVRFAMIATIASVFIARVGASYLFAFTFNMGIYGIWFAMAAEALMRSVLFVGRYISGKWTTKTVID